MASNQEQQKPGSDNKSVEEKNKTAAAPKHAPIDPSEDEEAITQEAEHSWKTGGA